jgi:hypothetical protein
MRVFLFIFCYMLLFQQCSTERKDKPVEAGNKNHTDTLGYMAVFGLFPGKWIKSNDSIEIVQEWGIDDSGFLKGYSYRHSGNDTSNQMNFTIFQKENPVKLTVLDSGNSNEMQYEVKKQDNNQVIFTNPDILFPFRVIFDFSEFGKLTWTQEGGSPDNEMSLSIQYHKIAD